MAEKKVGRPATGRKVITRSFCMAPDLLADLVSEAERCGRSTSSLLTEILESRYNAAHWTEQGSLSCRCSACGCKSPSPFAYCPNCGARMEE